MPHPRRTLLLLSLATLAPWPQSAQAGITVFAERGLAIRGYDPVAYFIEARPVRGQAAFTHSWNGATWRFASVANRDRFAAAPADFAPQYGGFCAWAVAHGYEAPIDPQAWKVVGGRLYLNYDRSTQRRWEADMTALIAKGDANWPALEAKLAAR
jgi:YHS domain-containing protein